MFHSAAANGGQDWGYWIWVDLFGETPMHAVVLSTAIPTLSIEPGDMRSQLQIKSILEWLLALPPSHHSRWLGNIAGARL